MSYTYQQNSEFSQDGSLNLTKLMDVSCQLKFNLIIIILTLIEYEFKCKSNNYIILAKWKFNTQQKNLS